MTLRTHRETLVFTQPFTLSGVEDVQAPGAYTVQTDEGWIQFSSATPRLTANASKGVR